jgi:hypothetical protein
VFAAVEKILLDREREQKREKLSQDLKQRMGR